MIRTNPATTTTAAQRRVDLDEMIESSAWARRLDPQALSRVLASVEARRVKPGDVIAVAGDPLSHWIGVVEGLVAVSVVSAEGKQSILTALAPGGWFGEGSLLRRETLRYNVFAVQPTALALLPLHVFAWLYRNSIEFNNYLIAALNDRLSQCVGLLEHERLGDVDARVAHCLCSLLDHCTRWDALSHLPLTQGQVGLLANLSRQRAHEALHALERRGLVEVRRSGVVVRDFEGLRAAAEGSCGPAVDRPHHPARRR